MLVDWLVGPRAREFGALAVETRRIENRAIETQGPGLR